MSSGEAFHPPFRWSRNGALFTSHWRVVLKEDYDVVVKLVRRAGIRVSVELAGTVLSLQVESECPALDSRAFSAFFSALSEAYRCGALDTVEGVDPSLYDRWFRGAD